MKISIGGDHAGYELKERIKEYLDSKNIEFLDKGPYSEESVDYPDFVHPVCNEVLEGSVDFGILICGTGNGVAMTANKYSGIRCGLCWTEEIAALIRNHNNANVLALPARFIESSNAISIVEAFLSNDFKGGRHARRVGKITPEINHLC